VTSYHLRQSFLKISYTWYS